MSYSVEFMRRHEVVLLSESAHSVTVGSATNLSEGLLRVLSAFHGRTVRLRALEPPELRARIQEAAASNPRPGAPRSPAPRVIGDADISIDELAADAPAVNLVNALLANAVRARASDIHVEARRTDASVRFRVDGRLVGITRLPLDRLPGFAARVKVLAGMNSAERRRAQDGRFSASIGNPSSSGSAGDGDTFDIRVSSLPTVTGESIVLRLFPQRRNAFSLGDLGLPEGDLAAVRSALRRASGLLLVSGPTGSGKTTTLHACLREIGSGGRKIVTIEDPVEYHLADIDQVQTNPAVGLTFDTILRRVLRQDPDVIMVGEIRDAETASLSVRAATTGHLVLSTVHARRAAEVTARLHSLGVDSDSLGAVAPIVAEQRLVRTRCSNCRGLGCTRCNATGFFGRTGIFGLIGPGARATTMSDDGTRKAASGQTTREEVAWAILE